MLPEAITIADNVYDLHPMPGAQPGAFITDPINIPCSIGEIVTATYVDPSDTSDTSSDTVTIVSTELNVESFYAGPNPFTDTVFFAYKGDGMATSFGVTVYDLSGHRVWQLEKANTLSVPWDGRDSDGGRLANGGYIYVVMATDGTNTFTGKGTVFINR